MSDCFSIYGYEFIFINLFPEISFASLINGFSSCFDSIALFDNCILEQGVFFRNNFLVDRTADLHFHVFGYLYRFLQPINVSIFTLNTAAACAMRGILLYSITRNLKYLS